MKWLKVAVLALGLLIAIRWMVVSVRAEQSAPLNPVMARIVDTAMVNLSKKLGKSLSRETTQFSVSEPGISDPTGNGANLPICLDSLPPALPPTTCDLRPTVQIFISVDEPDGTSLGYCFLATRDGSKLAALGVDSQPGPNIPVELPSLPAPLTEVAAQTATPFAPMPERGVDPAATTARKNAVKVGNGAADAVAWSPDGSTIAVGGSLGIWLYTPELKGIAHLIGNDDAITALAWSPDSQWIASASGDREVQIWNVASGIVHVLQKRLSQDPYAKGSVSFSPDGLQFASASTDNAVNIWDTASGKLAGVLQARGPVYSVAWNHDGIRLAAAGSQKLTRADPETHESYDDYTAALQVWDVKTGQVLNSYQDKIDPDPGSVYDAAYNAPIDMIQWYSHDSLLALTFSNGFPITGWNPNTGELVEINIFVACGTITTGVTFAPDGVSYAAALYSCDYDAGWVDIYAGNDGISQGAADAGHGYVRAMAWSPDSQSFVLVNGDGAITVRSRSNLDSDLRTFWPSYELDAFVRLPAPSWNMVQSLSRTEPFTPVRKSRSDYYPQEQTDFLQKDPNFGLQQAYRQKVISPDGKLLLVLQANNRYAVLNAANGVTLTELNVGVEAPGTEPSMSYLVWSVDGTKITALAASGPGPGSTSPSATTMVMWDLTQGGVHTEYLDEQAFDPAGKRLAERSEENGLNREQIAIIDPLRSEPPLILETPQDTATLARWTSNAMYWSPDGSQVASLWNGQLDVWNAQSGKLMDSLQYVTWMTWNPDSHSVLYTWSRARTNGPITAVDTHTAKEMFTLDGTTSDDAAHLFWEPSGQSVAIVGQNNQVHIWNATTGKQLQAIAGHSLAWNAGGTRLAIATEERTVAIYNTSTGAIATLLTNDLDNVEIIRFSPDGQRIATADSRGDICLWNATTGVLLSTLHGHIGAVSTLEWSADGNWLLSSGQDSTIRLWETTP